MMRRKDEKAWKSKAALKRAIRKFLDKHVADELDVADAMQIGLKLACSVTGELAKEGKIKAVDK